MREQMHTSNKLKIEQKDSQQKKGIQGNPEENYISHTVDNRKCSYEGYCKTYEVRASITYLLILKIYMGSKLHDGLWL